jgi:hypothetical protein
MFFYSPHSQGEWKHRDFGVLDRSKGYQLVKLIYHFGSTEKDTTFETKTTTLQCSVAPPRNSCSKSKKCFHSPHLTIGYYFGEKIELASFFYVLPSNVFLSRYQKSIQNIKLSFLEDMPSFSLESGEVHFFFFQKQIHKMKKKRNPKEKHVFHRIDRLKRGGA